MKITLKLALFAMLLPLAAMAQTPTVYTVTYESDSYAVTDGDGFVETASSIQDVIEAIRDEAAGADCGIKFGDGTVLNIGSESVVLERTTMPYWGNITLSGKISSTGNSSPVIYVKDNVFVSSGADISTDRATAIQKDARGNMSITGGIISAAARTIVNNADANFGIDITGGNISTTTSGNAIEIGAGYVKLGSGTSVSATGGSAVYSSGNTASVTVEGATLTSNSPSGTINTPRGNNITVSSGSIANTGTGRAIYNSGAMYGGIIVSGGTIDGGITNAGDGTDEQQGIPVTLSGSAGITSGGIINTGNYVGISINVVGTITGNVSNSGSNSGINLTGGTIAGDVSNSGSNSGINFQTGSTTSVSGNVINTGVTDAGITLSGNPYIGGSITTPEWSLQATALTGSRQYRLNISSIVNYVAVRDVDADYSTRFILSDPAYQLRREYDYGNSYYNLITELVPVKSNSTLYTITGSYGSFSATGTGGDVFSTSTGPIQTVIDEIKADRNTGDFTIQFGSGGVLNIGSDNIDLGSGWGGKITLSGRVISATSNIIFSEDFEGVSHGFTIVNGDQTNQWHVGTATASGGSKSAYISNDGGGSNSYNFNVTSVVHMYRDVTFPASSEDFTLSFDYKGVGESSDYDVLNVRLVETSEPMSHSYRQNSGSIGRYLSQSSWTNYQVAIPASNANSTKRLVFTWYNDGSVGSNPPAAVDNIVLLGPWLSLSPIVPVISFSGATNVESNAEIVRTSNGVVIANNGTGNLTINGGTIQAVNATSDAITNTSGGSIFLTGNPTITGIIKSSNALNAIGGFAPTAAKTYTVNLGNWDHGNTVVTGGAPFIQRFAITNASVGLMPSGSDIALRSGPGYDYAESNGVYTITSGHTYGRDIQGTINAIRDDAAGEDVEIKFGSTGTLNIGSSSILLSGVWGEITLSGGITSTYPYNVVTINGGITVNSGANITATSDRYSYVVNNYGTLTISGGTISTQNSSNIVNNSGTLTISGGTISATSNTAVNNSGTLTISGGTISATGSSSYAVNNNSYSSVILSGNPTITGSITNGYYSSLSVDAEFAPTAGKVYTLVPYSYDIGTTAVTNGKDKSAFFKFANDNYGLANAETGEDLVIVLDKGFVAVRTGNSFEVSNAYRGKEIQVVIDEIRDAAEGAPVAIKFGNGTDTLNIHDAAAIQFSNGLEEWGAITLSGKITNSSTNDLIRIDSDITVTSSADILKTNGGTPITNNGTLTITGGKIVSEGTAAIFNRIGGTLTISGGDISETTGSGDYVIRTNSTETLTISGGKISAKGTRSAIYNTSSGDVTISGGEISAVSGAAVYNASGKITVSSGANITSANSDNAQGTILNTSGKLVIAGGTITNTAPAAGYGNAISSSRYSLADTTIFISGGTISATATQGRAIVTTSDSHILVSGGTITSANTTANNGTITTASGGNLMITGGTIENTSTAANNNAIYANSWVTLGKAPNIIGYIKTYIGGNLRVIADVSDPDAFTPAAGKVYDIDFDTYYPGVAVVDGADFIDNFDLKQAASFALEANELTGNLDIVPVEFTFAKSTTTPGLYTISKVEPGIGTHSTLQPIINEIRDSAEGGPCTIQFGNGTSTFNIGTEVVTFVNSGFNTWGQITLSGKIKSTAPATIINVNGPSITSTIDIAKTTARAISNLGRGTITISSGNISSAYYTVYNDSIGKIIINGANINSTVDSLATVYLASNAANVAPRLEVNGGAIINSAANGNAIFNASMGTISLSGNPTITGTIRKSTAAGNIIAATGFAPTGSYLLDYVSYVPNSVAVQNGAANILNFALVNSTGYKLTASGTNLVIESEAQLACSATEKFENGVCRPKTAEEVCLESAGSQVIGGVCKTLPELVIIAKAACEADGGSYNETTSTCTTALEIAQAACVAAGGEFRANGTCKTATEISRETCLASGKIYGEDGTCKTALEIAESVCGTETGKKWQNGKCVSPIRILGLSNSQIAVKASKGAITLENLPKNAKVEIFNLNGKQIHSQFSILHSQFIPMQPGMYIVRINKETFRIAVK